MKNIVRYNLGILVKTIQLITDFMYKSDVKDVYFRSLLYPNKLSN